ncbi:MAG: hypothetical protein ACPGUV_02550 [Polyangiales bacterium]
MEQGGCGWFARTIIPALGVVVVSPLFVIQTVEAQAGNRVRRVGGGSMRTVGSSSYGGPKGLSSETGHDRVVRSLARQQVMEWNKVAAGETAPAGAPTDHANTMVERQAVLLRRRRRVAQTRVSQRRKRRQVHRSDLRWWNNAANAELPDDIKAKLAKSGRGGRMLQQPMRPHLSVRDLNEKPAPSLARNAVPARLTTRVVQREQRLRQGADAPAVHGQHVAAKRDPQWYRSKTPVQLVHDKD